MIEISTVAQPLRIVWLAVCAGAAVAVGVFGALAASRPAPMPEHAEAAFYLVALVSLVGTGAAFTLQRMMETRVARAGSDEEAAAALRTLGVASLAAAEAPALVGALAAFLTGDLLALAFAVPLFAFAWLTWPSDDRVGSWLAMRRR